jgi:hypothetical protein
LRYSPFAAGRLRRLFVLNASRDEFFVCVMIKRENVSTIITREKLAARRIAKRCAIS